MFIQKKYGNFIGFDLSPLKHEKIWPNPLESLVMEDHPITHKCHKCFVAWLFWPVFVGGNHLQILNGNLVFRVVQRFSVGPPSTFPEINAAMSRGLEENRFHLTSAMFRV